jgi:hypothetical protein
VGDVSPECFRNTFEGSYTQLNRRVSVCSANLEKPFGAFAPHALISLAYFVITSPPLLPPAQR